MSKRSGVILLILILCAYIPATAAFAQEQPEYPLYIVQSGDTLSIIAARFGVGVQNLIELNAIENPNLLATGTALKIPGYEGISGELILYTVTLGESYHSLTGKNRFQADLLSRLNRMTSPEELFVGSRLIMPRIEPEDQLGLLTVMPIDRTMMGLGSLFNMNPWVIALENRTENAFDILPGDYIFSQNGKTIQDQVIPGIVSLEIDPLPLRQGKTIEIRLLTTEPMDIEAEIAGHHTPFYEVGENEYVALQGIHARAETGVVSINVVGTRDGETVLTINQKVLVESGYYGQDPPISVDPITIQPDVIEPEQVLVEEIINKTSTDKYWSGIFRYPVDEPCVSAYYGGSRIYNNTYHYYHTGLDFNVCRASNINIYAVAPGYVVFAGPLIVRGNAVIIDHGWGVYSGYWHQSEIAVRNGEYLEAGQLIGSIGTTGRSTGSHLHLEIWVNGVQVDPLDWLQNEYPK
jgi:murein DD-endopeptidase MepM/ murein hydrolase activator NlpD